MDFKSVLSSLLKKFKENNVRHALMGGFALGIWGVGRTTVDLDFLVHREDRETMDIIMRELGYELKHGNENVSQYLSPLKVFGEVDYLHAFRKTSLEMLSRAEEKEVFEGTLKISVLRPEDLIGLKLQAIKNNPERGKTDMEDIKSLLSVPGGKLDWELIKSYCETLGMNDIYPTLRSGGGP